MLQDIYNQRRPRACIWRPRGLITLQVPAPAIRRASPPVPLGCVSSAKSLKALSPLLLLCPRLSGPHATCWQTSAVTRACMDVMARANRQTGAMCPKPHASARPRCPSECRNTDRALVWSLRAWNQCLRWPGASWHNPRHGGERTQAMCRAPDAQGALAGHDTRHQAGPKSERAKNNSTTHLFLGLLMQAELASLQEALRHGSRQPASPRSGAGPQAPRPARSPLHCGGHWRADDLG